MKPSEKDEALFEAIREIFNEKVPFNKALGLSVKSLQYDRVVITFKMNKDLVGNYMRGTLHGGMISTAIDVTGGLAAFMGIQQKMPEADLETKLKRFSRLGTIDLRVDYLRPGVGKWFDSTGYTLRAGNRVVVTRIELTNDSGDLVAVGTVSYVVA